MSTSFLADLRQDELLRRGIILHRVSHVDSRAGPAGTVQVVFITVRLDPARERLQRLVLETGEDSRLGGRALLERLDSDATRVAHEDCGDDCGGVLEYSARWELQMGVRTVSSNSCRNRCGLSTERKTASAAGKGVADDVRPLRVPYQNDLLEWARGDLGLKLGRECFSPGRRRAGVVGERGRVVDNGGGDFLGAIFYHGGD